MKCLISIFLVVLIGCEDYPTDKKVLYVSEDDVLFLQDTMDFVAHIRKTREIDNLKEEIGYLKQRVWDLEIKVNRPADAIERPLPIPMRYPVRPELYYLKSFLPWALQPGRTRDTFFAHGKYSKEIP